MHRGEDDPDARPFVVASIGRATSIVTGTARHVLRGMGRRTLMWLWGGGTVALLVTTLVLGVAAAPDAGAVVGAIFGSIFLALLFAAAMGWVVVWSLKGERLRGPEPERVQALEEMLGGTLRELDAVRAEISRQVKARSVLRVPLGIAAAVLLWVLGQWGDDPPTVVELVMFVLFGAVAGEVWAFYTLDRDYRRLYKRRVLPRLAAQYGELTYREPQIDEVRQFCTRVMRGFDRVTSEDEISGTYRELPIAIREVTLDRRSGKRRQVMFDGLFVEITLPRALTAVTTIVAQEGLLQSLTAQWRSSLARVRLEDVRFERRYEVYGSDQIEARALLTPAFMERFLALGSAGGPPPGAFAEGSRLTIALPKGLTGNLFEPPPYWQHAGGRVLAALSDDIQTALRMADTVIELDFFARGAAGTSR